MWTRVVRPGSAPAPSCSAQISEHTRFFFVSACWTSGFASMRSWEGTEYSLIWKTVNWCSQGLVSAVHQLDHWSWDSGSSLWKCKQSLHVLWVYCGTPGYPGTHFGNHSLGCTMQCPVLNDLCSKLLVIHGNVGMERQPRKHFSHLTQDVSSD